MAHDRSETEKNDESESRRARLRNDDKVYDASSKAAVAAHKSRELEETATSGRRARRRGWRHTRSAGAAAGRWTRARRSKSDVSPRQASRRARVLGAVLKLQTH